MQSIAGRRPMLPLTVVAKSEGETPEQRIIYAEVYAPNRPDCDDEYMTAEEIRKMAHEFTRKGLFTQVDVQHDNVTVPGVQIIESFIARKGDPDGFIEGAWVVGVHIPDDNVWAKIKSGEINGLSMEAFVRREEQVVEIEIPPVITGMTQKNEEHAHKFYVSYDDDLNFLGGITDEVDGHSHVIRAGTVTEDANGHSHRFSAVDEIEIVR